MDYKKDTAAQVDQDANDFRNLVGEMGRTERSEIAEAKRQEQIEEVKNRMINLYELGAKIKQQLAKRNTYYAEHNGNRITFDIHRNSNPESVSNESTRITITGSKRYDLVISKTKEGLFYVDYNNEDKTWRKNPNNQEPSKSNQFDAEAALTGIPELKEIETILMQLDKHQNTEVSEQEAA